MASVLQQQTVAAQDGTFQQMVRDAIVQTAINVYSEATTLSANIKTGATSVSIPLSVALAAAIPANTTIHVGGELFVSTAGAAQNATSIPTTTTAAMDHIIGESVSPPSVSNHTARAVFARLVLNNPEAWTPAFAAACASAGLTNASTDAAVSNEVSAVWNAMAGA